MQSQRLRIEQARDEGGRSHGAIHDIFDGLRTTRIEAESNGVKKCAVIDLPRRSRCKRSTWKKGDGGDGFRPRAGGGMGWSISSIRRPV
jgi:hypothetical protein